MIKNERNKKCRQVREEKDIYEIVRKNKRAKMVDQYIESSQRKEGREQKLVGRR